MSITYRTSFLPFNSFLLIAITHSIHSFRVSSDLFENSILLAAFVVLWFRHIALDQWRICKIAMSRCCWKGETEWNTSHRTKNFTYIPSQNWMKTNTIACFHRVFPFALLDVFLSIYLSFDTQLLIRGHSCLPAMNWIALLCFASMLFRALFLLRCVGFIYLFIFLGVGIATRWHVELLK